jgi:hypothetical protein
VEAEGGEAEDEDNEDNEDEDEDEDDEDEDEEVEDEDETEDEENEDKDEDEDEDDKAKDCCVFVSLISFPSMFPSAILPLLLSSSLFMFCSSPFTHPGKLSVCMLVFGVGVCCACPVISILSCVFVCSAVDVRSVSEPRSDPPHKVGYAGEEDEDVEEEEEEEEAG